MPNAKTSKWARWETIKEKLGCGHHCMPLLTVHVCVYIPWENYKRIGASLIAMHLHVHVPTRSQGSSHYAEKPMLEDLGSSFKTCT